MLLQLISWKLVVFQRQNWVNMNASVNTGSLRAESFISAHITKTKSRFKTIRCNSQGAMANAPQIMHVIGYILSCLELNQTNYTKFLVTFNLCCDVKLGQHSTINLRFGVAKPALNNCGFAIITVQYLSLFKYLTKTVNQWPWNLENIPLMLREEIIDLHDDTSIYKNL